MTITPVLGSDMFVFTPLISNGGGEIQIMSKDPSLKGIYKLTLAATVNNMYSSSYQL